MKAFTNATPTDIRHAATLARQAGSDFRLPTVAELDELEAFQKSVGRRVDLNLTTLRFKSEIAEAGAGSVTLRSVSSKTASSTEVTRL